MGQKFRISGIDGFQSSLDQPLRTWREGVEEGSPDLAVSLNAKVCK